MKCALIGRPALLSVGIDVVSQVEKIAVSQQADWISTPSSHFSALTQRMHRQTRDADLRARKALWKKAAPLDNLCETKLVVPCDYVPYPLAMIDDRHAAIIPASVTSMLQRLEDKDDTVNTGYDHERIVKMVNFHLDLWTPRPAGKKLANIKPLKTELKSTGSVHRRTSRVSYTMRQSLFIQKVIGDLIGAGFIFKNNGCSPAIQRLFPSPSAASADRQCFKLDYTEVEDEVRK